jgi:glutathione S-transferase
LSNKPADFQDKYAQACGNTSTRAKVPLLEYGDTLVIESLDVAKFIARNVVVGGVDSKDDQQIKMMYPSEDVYSARIDQFIDAFEATIQAYYNFLTASSKSEADAAKGPFGESLDHLQDYLGEDGPFLLGDSFSVAECIVAPWVHRFSIVLPHFRAVTVNELVSSPRVQAWLDAVLERPSVQSTNGPSEYVLSSTQGYFVNYITPGSPAAQ